MDTSTLLTPEDCVNICAQVQNGGDATLVDFTVVPIGQKSWKLEITLNRDLKTENLELFVKDGGPGSKVYAIFDTLGPEIAPKLYYTKQDLHVFEDLRTHGFRNHESRLNFLNVDHLEKVLHTLAQFHCFGWAFEEMKSKEAGRIVRLDQEHGLGTSTEVEELQGSSKFRRTLCHGRLLSENVMFKYKDGTPVECKLTNFDYSYYGIPVADVLQVIFFNSSEELRQHHFHALLAHYLGCLRKELNKYDLNSDDYLSSDDLEVATHLLLPLIKVQTKEEPLTDSPLSKEDCYAIVRNKIGTTNYEFLSFETKPLSNVSGFLGQYFRLEIRIRHLGVDQTVNCFVKGTPKSGTSFEIAQQLEVFSREVFVYDVLVKEMHDSGITTIDKCIPACYFHRFDDLMVFEDLSRAGFENMDALKPFDFDLLELTTKKMAQFHACSIVLEEKSSFRIIDRYGKYFKETLFFIDDHHLGARSFMTGIKGIPGTLDLFPELKTETNQRNFEECWPKLQQLFYEVMKPSKRYRNTLSHGDFWVSNMLVKFEDRKPVDCVLFDFQIVRYCPPVYDLLSVLYRATNPPNRVKYETELIQIYYNELSEVLRSYGYSIETIYPYDDYIASIEYMKPQMVINALIEYQLTMCTPEEISSFLTDEEIYRKVFFEDRSEFVAAMCEKSELYRTRIKECVIDVYNYCKYMLSQ